MNEAASKKFKAEFTSSFEGWDYTELNDVVGFTLRGKYSTGELRALKVDGDYNYVPFLNFYFDRKSSDTTGSDFISLIVSVGISLFEKTGSGLSRFILDNSHIKSKINKPLEIRTTEDYYFKPKNGKLYRNKKGKFTETTLKKIYDEVMRLHVASYRNYVGIRARIRVLILRTLPLWSLEAMNFVMGLTLWVINGHFYKHDPLLEAFREESTGYSRIERKDKELKREVDFFGYKVAVWTLFSYSVTSIILLLLLYVYEKHIFNWVGTMEIVTVSFAIASIIMYDRIVPYLFKMWIRMLSTKSSDLKFKGVRLKI